MDRQARSYQRTSISRAIIAGCLLLCACSAAIAQSPDLPKKAAPPHAVSPHFFGVNIENSYMSPPVIAWDDPTLLRAIKQVGIQAVRFPGGDVGNYWDWQNGTVYPLGKASKTQDTLSALSNLARATGVYPIYNLNVMTLNNAILHRADLSQGISNQLRMLDAAHDMKLPVADLELGNEFFWGSPDQSRAFPAATDYATEMNQWAASLKQAYPYARIAAVASIPASRPVRTQTWNAAVVGKIRDVDAFTLHRYDNILDGGIWDGTAPDAALGHVFTDWATIVSGEVRPIEKAKLHIWVTEFGGMQDCTAKASFMGTWLEALYQSQMAIQFLSTPSIDQIELYNITGSTGSLMFQNTSSYWDACQNKSITFHGTYGDLTATGQAYALFGAALKHAKAVTPLGFPEASVVRPKAGLAYPAVTGVALTGEKDQWILLNLSSKPITLRYPGMGHGTIESIHASSLMTMVTSEHRLTHETHGFEGRGFVLPAFSVNRLVEAHSVQDSP